LKLLTSITLGQTKKISKKPVSDGPKTGTDALTEGSDERQARFLFGDPAIHLRKEFGGPVALRPEVTPGLLLSENYLVTLIKHQIILLPFLSQSNSIRFILDSFRERI